VFTEVNCKLASQISAILSGDQMAKRLDDFDTMIADCKEVKFTRQKV